jgi:K+-sensing histidine kinase KdpD
MCPNSSVDVGIQEAVEAFSLVQTGLRERFAAALTHDLRGPLGVAATSLELILLIKDPEKITTAAAKALTNIRRVRSMVDELLDTMSFQGGQQVQLKVSNFDILEVIKEVQADAVAVHGPRFQVLERSVMGWWDRSALKRATENLITNAIKYGSPDTPVTLTIGEEHGRMMLSVHNEGEPIPPDESECIFQMYRRAESAKRGVKQGWGIGLPYVRAIAESHAGSVMVDSSAARGSTLMINTPVDVRPYQLPPSLA